MSARAGYLVALALSLVGGCDNMAAQPKQKVYSPEVGPGPLPPHMVEFRSSMVPPPAVTRALLERGQERHRIYCAPCHSELGDGRGMVVQRGFPEPPSYHDERLRAAPPEYFYDVITRGRGTMYSFAERVPPADRWAIAAYIRALQFSQRATLADLAPAARDALP